MASGMVPRLQPRQPVAHPAETDPLLLQPQPAAPRFPIARHAPSACRDPSGGTLRLAAKRATGRGSRNHACRYHPSREGVDHAARDPTEHIPPVAGAEHDNGARARRKGEKVDLVLGDEHAIDADGAGSPGTASTRTAGSSTRKRMRTGFSRNRYRPANCDDPARERSMASSGTSGRTGVRRYRCGSTCAASPCRDQPSRSDSRSPHGLRGYQHAPPDLTGRA